MHAGADEVRVAARSARGQTPLADQVIVVAAEQLLHRARRNLFLHGKHAQRGEVVQQRPQRLHRPVPDIPSSSALIQIPLDHRTAQAAEPDAPGAHPAIQMREEAHVLRGRRPRIALPQQLFGEPGDARLERPAHERPQHLDHDALLSTTEKQASISSPDYADLASPKSLRRKGSSVNIGIIQRSA
jgi:hypothetical protein